MKCKITLIGLLVISMKLVIAHGTPLGQTNFNHNWNFVISDKPIDQEGVESITWEAVSLPHTPKIENKVMDGQWQGICWYHKTFQLGKEAKGKRLYMRFEGAMHASEFWVNGKKVASHLDGYLPVVFDFTELAKIGGSNEVLVRLNNHDNEISGPKPMRKLDFNMYGGLHRDAFLIVKDPLHITDPIHANKIAGGGIFVTYPKVSANEAVVQVKTNILNRYDSRKKFIVVNELWDGNKLVVSNSSPITVADAGKDSDVTALLTVGKPNLWSTESPSLYTLKTKIVSNKKVVDELTTRIGIRHIRFTNDAFYINGEKIFLRGVNRHQDYPYVGYALSNNAQYRDAVKIKEAGFDYVRLSHYPHSPAFMDACDELGLVVLDAILGWQYYRKDSAFKNHVLWTCRELVRRDRNHPCVIAWELSLNESWMEESFIDKAHGIGHEEYPGDQCYTAGWQTYGYDIYLQARQHRLEHYKNPKKPYNVSEYGDWEYYAMNAGLNQDTWGDLLQADRSSRQLLTDGEVRLLQQATNVQEAHNDNFNTPAHADSYWVMFDYNRGYSNDLEASGIMSIDRLPKFSYYFYQSQRNASLLSELYQSGPMVHIASWWTKDSPLNLRVFSNCEEVELIMNEKSLGRQKPDENRISNNLAHPPFTFQVSAFEPGELTAKAFIAGKEVATHRVKTPGNATSLLVTIDESRKVPQAGCNDVVFVYAQLVDANGTIVRENNVNVKFELSGDATILNPEAIKTEAGIASALVKIGNTPGPVTIGASGKNLNGILSITVK